MEQKQLFIAPFAIATFFIKELLMLIMDSFIPLDDHQPISQAHWALALQKYLHVHVL